MPDENSKLVYSTEQAIPHKEKHADKASTVNLCTAMQRVTVRLERKKRGGKSVTAIEGIEMPQKKKDSLLKKLKGNLGTGGTVRDTSLEIQGNHCDTIISLLIRMGYKPKRSGG